MNSVVVAAGLARMLVATDSAPPDMQPDQAVLFVHRTATCTSDAGVPDAAVPDAATADAATADAGIPDAGATMCGDSMMMVVQPRFSVDRRGSRFALLYVTPGAPAVRLESPTTFDDLAQATAPEIDTVEVPVEDPALGTRCPSGCGAPAASNEQGCGGGGYSTWMPPTLDGGVTVPSLQTIGPYDVASMQPATRAELAGWLDKLGYVYTTGDLDAVDPYLTIGWHVVAVRITATGQISGGLQPLSMTWSGSELRVPLGLATDQTGITVYVESEHRVDLSDAHVSFADYLASGGYLTRNEVTSFGGDPVGEIPPSEQPYREVVTQEQQVRVPVSKCDDGGCCQTGGSDTTGAVYLAVLMVACRPRRSARRRRAARTPGAPSRSSARS